MARTMISALLFAILFLIADAEAEAQYGMVYFSPRFMFGSIAKVAKRQSDGECNGPGFHTCLEVNQSTSCCSNSDYCYLSPEGVVSCCQINSNCDNQCSSSSEIAFPQTITASNGNTSTTFSCSPRACPATSEFLCPSSLGGGCCGYGSICGSNSACTSTIDPSTVISSTPTGCMTGQFSCPTGEGGGCCNNDSNCTASDSTLLCVVTTTTGSGSITPTVLRTGPSGVTTANNETSSTSSGLSSGAKAGIGVGVALGVIIAAAGIFWFAMSRRRAYRNQQAQAASAGEDSAGGEKNPAAKSKAGTDYFGTTAKAGPYTETTTTGTPLGSPENMNRGVPLSPQGPGDIAAPVEIADSAPAQATEAARPYVSDTPENPEFRIELP